MFQDLGSSGVLQNRLKILKDFGETVEAKRVEKVRGVTRADCWGFDRTWYHNTTKINFVKIENKRTSYVRRGYKKLAKKSVI